MLAHQAEPDDLEMIHGTREVLGDRKSVV